MIIPEKTLSHLRAINYICLHSEGRRTGPRFVSVLELPQVCDQRLPMCPPWSACKGQPKRRGNTLLPLQGVKFPGYTRLPRVPLRLPWAKRSLGFQPVIPDGPFVPDFARQTGHLKKFANSLIRDKLFI